MTTLEATIIKVLVFSIDISKKWSIFISILSIYSDAMFGIQIYSLPLSLNKIISPCDNMPFQYINGT